MLRWCKYGEDTGLETSGSGGLARGLGLCGSSHRGSHKQYCHMDGRTTTVPFHPGRDLSPLLLRQIAKDIGLAMEEFIQGP